MRKRQKSGLGVDSTSFPVVGMSEAVPYTPQTLASIAHLKARGFLDTPALERRQLVEQFQSYDDFSPAAAAADPESTMTWPRAREDSEDSDSSVESDIPVRRGDTAREKSSTQRDKHRNLKRTTPAADELGAKRQRRSSSSTASEGGPRAMCEKCARRMDNLNELEQCHWRKCFSTSPRTPRGAAPRRRRIFEKRLLEEIAQSVSYPM